MKRMTRKIALVALTLAVMLLFTACSVKKQVVATVGEGKNAVEVTLTELTNYYQNYLSQMSSYGYSIDTTSDESRTEMVESLLTECVRNAVEIYKAREAGIELTAEEQAEVKAAAEADYDSFWQSFISYATQQGATDVQAQATKLLTSTLVQNGTTVKKVKADYLRSETDSKMVEKNKAKLLEGKEATEEILKGLYEEEVKSQTEAIAADPSAYFTQDMYASYGYGYPAFVIPEGLFYVRHILVEDEQQAKDIKARIDAGEDFETLLKEFNTDPGMESTPEGYVVGQGANFVTEFLDAALALQNEGDVSEPVKSQYGYHIIKRLGNVEAKTMTFEEAGETFTATAAEEYNTKQYETIVDGWVAEEGLVKTFPEIYANVGK